MVYTHCCGRWVIRIAAEDGLYSWLRKMGYTHCCGRWVSLHHPASNIQTPTHPTSTNPTIQTSTQQTSHINNPTSIIELQTPNIQTIQNPKAQIKHPQLTFQLQHRQTHNSSTKHQTSTNPTFVFIRMLFSNQRLGLILSVIDWTRASRHPVCDNFMIRSFSSYVPGLPSPCKALIRITF